ncbi:FecR domain-containing protein [Ottowia thiooxydans]|uniref:FecR domain-containing protein n=1 Tax=Ottowia thiooxydans TaxID=219182 RepID=UPI00042A6ACB|nr:FecR domain-containing protein [Ottowia thiooxydans]
MSQALPLETRPFDAAVAREATEWLVVLASGTASDADKQRWHRWLEADEAHVRAWEHIEAVNRRLRGLPSGVGLAALSAPSSARRRDALKLLSVLFVTGGAGWMTYRATPWQEWVADYRTSTGERRTLTLDDGTQLALNTNTAVDVIYDGDWRLIRLRAGEALITSGHRSLPNGGTDLRPLVVETHEGRVRALGTRFSVRQEGGRSAVSVFEGGVEIRPSAPLAKAQVVRAGQRASFGKALVSDISFADERTVAWTDGLIVAQDRVLSEFIAELARYRPGRLACDEAIAHLRVSGVFKLDDTDQVLAALTDALPVRIHYRTRYWVTVVPGA